MAMPYMENAADPVAFYKQLVDKLAEHPGAMGKVVFELQTVDWRKDSAPIPSPEIAATIRQLYALGVQNVAYYPDNVYNNVPNPAALRPAFDSKPNNPLPLPVIR
jgi:biofilm PGA synthesis lipoprotein PgaB